MYLKAGFVAAALVCASAGAVVAEEFEVQMLNSGPDGEMMVFEPAYLEIAPGDTVTFVPTDPGHNAESITEMLPEGAEAFKGEINEEISVTFEQEGVYGYKCAPHFALGMIGLIVVGDATPDAEAAQAASLPPLADERMTALLEQAMSGEGEATDDSQDASASEE